ncbi:hypothetical protein [Bacillus xiapuensis]|uniref:hypothetical protein n=1 Tax=Bacillus xiapuensis TaxID=2014075 RepID=UPI000C24B8BD|nr:hypothetical protein [Bacillus xiapuensis]
MKKKLLKLAGGSLLAAMLLAGCATDNDNDNNDNNNGNENPVEEGEENVEDTGNKVKEDVNEEMNDEHLPKSEDKNRNGDGDVIKDENTPTEDPIEDQTDMQDQDNKDE